MSIIELKDQPNGWHIHSCDYTPLCQKLEFGQRGVYNRNFKLFVPEQLEKVLKNLSPQIREHGVHLVNQRSAIICSSNMQRVVIVYKWDACDKTRKVVSVVMNGQRVFPHAAKSEKIGVGERIRLMAKGAYFYHVASFLIANLIKNLPSKKGFDPVPPFIRPLPASNYPKALAPFSKAIVPFKAAIGDNSQALVLFKAAVVDNSKALVSFKAALVDNSKALVPFKAAVVDNSKALVSFKAAVVDNSKALVSFKGVTAKACEKTATLSQPLIKSVFSSKKTWFLVAALVAGGVALAISKLKKKPQFIRIGDEEWGEFAKVPRVPIALLPTASLFKGAKLDPRLMAHADALRVKIGMAAKETAKGAPIDEPSMPEPPHNLSETIDKVGQKLVQEDQALENDPQYQILY